MDTESISPNVQNERPLGPKGRKLPTYERLQSASIDELRSQSYHGKEKNALSPTMQAAADAEKKKSLGQSPKVVGGGKGMGMGMAKVGMMGVGGSEELKKAMERRTSQNKDDEQRGANTEVTNSASPTPAPPTSSGPKSRSCIILPTRDPSEDAKESSKPAWMKNLQQRKSEHTHTVPKGSVVNSAESELQAKLKKRAAKVGDD
eukprot:CAMPEP_0196571674 /NCGR_PEP_ID=MMETSP1081-20130531/1822_1 /TAXON_ID=36882 /ORGANISM="Pyramimonas amylifera, Strain CCMP720" /LENGTH=203 /DNA_ID=CAMNT_0041888707 /DNA_START=387 /DNA_END=998 /DNA_ORIENTATION=+